jgi:hypothetical protein
MRAGGFGQSMYGVIRYREDEHPAWGAAERAFAQASRGHRKWVASRTLDEIGPNARLIGSEKMDREVIWLAIRYGAMNRHP